MNIVILCLLVALVWGIAPIFEKLSLKHISAFGALTIRSTVTTVVLITLAFMMGRQKEILGVDGKTLVYILLGGVFGILGLFIYFVALKQDAASRVVPLVNIFPLFTVLYSIVLLNETVTPMRLAGILLVVGGVYLINVGHS